MVILALILIVAAVGVWVALPLTSSAAAGLVTDHDPADELEARRRQLLLAIRDVDFELQTGKVSQEDHALLRQRLQAEAVDVLRRLDQARKSPARHRRVG